MHCGNMKFLLLFIIGASVQADPIAFNDCGSINDLIEVNISGCTKIPCPLIIGREYQVSMRMTHNVKSITINQLGTFRIFGIEEFAQVTPEDPCATISCPAYTGNADLFSAQIKVPEILVPTSGLLKWVMKNNYGMQIICMTADVTLVR